MGENKTIILNGSKVWFTLIMFVMAHGSAGVWWASSINVRVNHVEKEVIELKEAIKDNSSLMRDLIKEMQVNERVKRSA